MSSLPYSTRPLYYAGKPQSSLSPSPKTFQTIDPSTSKPLANVVQASESDIDAALQSAKAAFRTWSRTAPIERSRTLLRAVALLRSRNDALARIETHDTGKPYSETSAVDIVTGADVLEYYASLVAGGGLNGQSLKLREGVWVHQTREPVGVGVGIGAWNYPMQIALWKSAACLAAGNTMVYKPSEFTPLHGLELAQIYSEAGLPPGVFNVVNGDGGVGAYLSRHPLVAKVSFTGQVSTGRKVAAAAAGELKYVTMELGGKSPLIVLEDADVDVAVDGAMMANFFSSGQVCTNGTRVFVHERMRSKFEGRLLQKMGDVRAGDLMDPETNFGPLVSKVHRDKVVNYIKHGINTDKARLLAGGIGKPEKVPRACEDGYWVRPTVFTAVKDDMLIAREEIFGPVMCILTYNTVEEVIRRANETSLGLAAGVFTKDLLLASKVIDELEAGITWVNTWGESPAEMSVGGWKQSGLGIENGTEGIKAWTRNKSTLIDTTGSVATAFTAKIGTKL